MLSAGTYAQQTKPFVQLPDGAVHKVSRLCSREGLQNLDGSWRPTKGQIELLESRLLGISRLLSNDKLERVRISDPRHYYRQYLSSTKESVSRKIFDGYSYLPSPRC